MVRKDIQSRLLEKLEQKREKLEGKIAEAETQKQELATQSAEIETALRDLEAEMEAVMAEAAPGAREQLEVRRERLLAQRERLQLKISLEDTRIAAIQHTLDSLQHEWGPGAWANFSGAGVPPVPPVPPMPPHISPKQHEQERLKILQMVADGSITAEDAARLIEALERSSRVTVNRRPRVVRIQVTDLATDRLRVNVTLPLSLLRGALKMGKVGVARFGVEGIDFDMDELQSLLDSGVTGHLVDVVDSEGNERVEIIVE